MKKLLTLLMAAALLCLPAHAANVATAQTALPSTLYGGGPVIPYTLTFDTTATDLTIRTPGTGMMVCIVGWQFVETSATNVTLTSGSTAYPAFELAANQGLYHVLGDGIGFCTAPSAALKMQVSVAVTGMTLYVIEVPKLIIK